MHIKPTPGLYLSYDGRTRILVQGVFDDLASIYQVDFLYADEAANMQAPQYCYARPEWERLVNEKSLTRAPRQPEKMPNEFAQSEAPT